MDRETILKHTPLLGPAQDSALWSQMHRELLTASIAAAALGLSDYKQPLDIYHLLVGNVEPFEGNEFTQRGKRFEPFLALEYQHHTGHALETGLPLQIHGHLQFLGASPDARRVANIRHGAELKACNYRQAAKLGEEGSDEIFPEWLCQAEVQCLVCGFDLVDVFVMIDLHTYKLYQVQRNDDLIVEIAEGLTKFWEDVQARREPDLIPGHGSSKGLLHQLYDHHCDGVIVLSDREAELWARSQRLKEEIADAERERETIRNQMLDVLGTNAVGRLPQGTREITRSLVKPQYWQEADVSAAQMKVGQIKRNGYATLRERKAK